MLPARPLGPKSSLLSHSFPSFYACYLLKSIKTPQSTTVYIGSTPSPPRRIRQHNGEIAQGARKTRSKRPWIMQMIVHGFPSRLAALQFEWAWQHPHKSRHLRDANGSIFGTRASKLLKKNIGIVRTMISKHPFNTWPLHVKLFTEEAVQCWKAFANAEPPLPSGFTCSVELEGVDGKSGHPGSGRQGPIDVDDADFTYTLLAKNDALIASGRRLDCSVCHQSIENYSSDHLATALCPSSRCIAVSHLTCLSQDFLKQSSGTTEIIPRGGHCKSCHNYILWGDVVRGCYRRLPQAVGDEHPDVATDDMFLSDEDHEELDFPEKRKSSVRSRGMSPSKPRSNSRRKGNIASQSSEGELFDFTNIVSSSDSEETPVKRKPGRPRKHTPSPQIVSPISERRILPRSPNVANRKRKEKDAAETLAFVARDSVEVIDITSGSEDGGILPNDMFRTPSKRKGKEKVVAPTSSEGEIFNLDDSSSSSDGENIGSTKKQPSRTQKLKMPLPAVQVRLTDQQKSPGTSLTSGSSLGDIGSTKRRPGRPRKQDLKSPNALIPPSSSNEGNSSVKRRPGRPRQFDAQSTKLGSTGVEDVGSVKRRPGRPRKLDFPSPTTLRPPVESPNSVIRPLSPKAPTLLEVQVSSSSESDNQGTLKRRPGRPRKDPSVGTPSPISPRKMQKNFQERSAPFLSRPYHPSNLPNRGASENTAYKSDRHSYECPKFGKYDLEHAMLNLTLTTLKVILSSGNVLSD